MGQAKQRGTLAQRQAEGRARVAAENSAAHAAYEAREAAMTPEERKKRDEFRILLATMGYDFNRGRW